jgi:hypothetical protein
VEKTTDLSQVSDKLDHIILYHQLFGVSNIWWDSRVCKNLEKALFCTITSVDQNSCLHFVNISMISTTLYGCVVVNRILFSNKEYCFLIFQDFHNAAILQYILSIRFPLQNDNYLFCISMINFVKMYFEFIYIWQILISTDTAKTKIFNASWNTTLKLELMNTIYKPTVKCNFI